jgi:hypothetical protein
MIPKIADCVTKVTLIRVLFKVCSKGVFDLDPSLAIDPPPQGAEISTERSENFNEFNVLFLNVKSYANIKPEISGDDLKFLRRPTYTTTVSRRSVEMDRR